MNRSLTNVIRFFMDECIPPLIRDSRWFMYPFFYLAYNGKNIKEAMDFKQLVYGWTEEEYSNFYGSIDSISRNRVTDMNEPSIQALINNLDKTATTIIDVGCGKGYLLSRLKRDGIRLSGCDVVDKREHADFEYHKANITKLPFADKQFDIVTCCHTIEHIIEEQKAIDEVKRIARKQLMIVVPCQRYFNYTLDEHVNFYPLKEKLIALIGLEKYTCEKVNGDWVYIGEI